MTAKKGPGALKRTRVAGTRARVANKEIYRSEEDALKKPLID